MSNGNSNSADHWSHPIAGAGQDYPLFLAAQADSCVDALRRGCEPWSPAGPESEPGTAAEKWLLPQAIEPLDINRATLAHAAAAIDGAIYSYEPQTGCVERMGDVHDVLGYSAEVMQLSQAWWRSLIHSEDRGRAQSVYQHAVATGAPRMSVEYRIRHACGHYVDILDRATLVRDAAGTVVRVIGCIEDVTEVRRSQQALRDADRRKDEFLATLGHELRNPLTPIRYALEVIGRESGDAAASERACAIIERQFVQLVRLVDDMLDVSSIACGRIVLRKERVELHGVLKSAVEAVRPLIDAKQHELELLMPLASVHLNADGARLIQVVTNLLTNAVKYTPEGGQIRLAARLDSASGTVEVRVRDTGIGIPAAELGRIFEMFARVDDEHGRLCGGLGIGLAVARDLAASHGGSITAHSAGPGHGSEFVLVLPADVVHAAAQPDGPSCTPATVVRDYADALGMT